ncbi:hypothetical protein ACWIGW_44350 [Nocardia brasiliensis]|uniref:hypothetical protein n=1 Tax=Streptomyces sp. NPDC056056 TaxID=3345698 RepID=UPI0035E294BE
MSGASSPETQQPSSSEFWAAVYAINLPIRRPPMTSNDQRRAHWTTVRKAKAEVAELVGWHGRTQLPKQLRLDRARVTVVWHAPDARNRDSDSLGPFLKATLDALVTIGVLPDDNSKHVVETRQRIEIDRANPHITIEIAPDIPTPGSPVSAPMSVDRRSGTGPTARTLSKPSRTRPVAVKRAQVSPLAQETLSAAPAAAPHAPESSLTPANPVAAERVSLPPRPSRPAVLRDTSRCSVCGDPIIQPGTGRPKWFCGTACRVRAHRTGKKERTEE